MSHSYGEVKQIGRMRYLFYELRHNKSWRDAIEYALSFSGYMETVRHLNQLLKSKQIAPCRFGEKKDKMVGSYYPPQPKNKRHSYSVKNYMITGPNAAGKTTFIKTAMLNVLFSQQVGCGFYKKYYMKSPYQNLFCYLNIPDTSGRDSLFQAEARRCKEVLDEVQKGEKTLCIFDELFSGTNPNEASASAYAFLKYLNGLPNVTFLLTTHFLDVCTRLEPEIQNAHMTTLKTTSGDLQYTYKFEKGISKVKGALKVLKDLNYPPSILDCAQNFN
jgi:DNA mismatch repair ATPase MutS